MALADSVTAYVTAALSGAGEWPPEVDREETLDAAAELGRRLLARFQEPAAGGAGLRGPLAYLTSDPESVRARKAVRQRIRRMLAADQGLAVEAGQMVAGFLTEVTAAGDAEALADLGDLLRDQGDADAVRAACQQALDSGNPEAGYALTVLGQVLREQGDADGARAAFQRSVPRSPSSSAPPGTRSPAAPRPPPYAD